MEHATKGCHYKVHILHTAISCDMKAQVMQLQNEWFEMEFVNVTEQLALIRDKLHVRDYYSSTTYYRLLIADMYPAYDKVIYLDCDTVVLGDISELYETDLGEHYVGASPEQAMLQTEVYGNYVERALGIDRRQFFNAGVLLINCRLFREHRVLEQFIDLLHRYTFVVTQDEDYLNVICKNKVQWLSPAWNTEVYGELPVKEEEIKLIHYIMVAKPWHFPDCRLKEYFWRYAEKTQVYPLILEELHAYTDEKRAADLASCERLAETAKREAEREDTYFASLCGGRAPDRVLVQERIARYEREGRWHEDVENDPPTRPLTPGEVDFCRTSLVSRCKAEFALAAAHRFVRRLLKTGEMVMDGIEGIEHFRALESGAIITCNHFNAFDSFAIHMAYDASRHKKRKFYRVIREGNYTSFPGFYGKLMRNCYTLPLSQNKRVMTEFVRATNAILQAGHFILVYPEGSMWWNYRKPKPLQSGAYHMAAKNNVPLLPCFITLRDTDTIGADG
jgi:lipopolysaccharide biosynthesis glycosyltransferase